VSTVQGSCLDAKISLSVSIRGLMAPETSPRKADRCNTFYCFFVVVLYLRQKMDIPLKAGGMLVHNLLIFYISVADPE
jgi:hypothetical protein